MPTKLPRKFRKLARRFLCGKKKLAKLVLKRWAEQNPDRLSIARRP